ncbi:MAG: SUMF1/EgtB/PvdO family nonheme iron enzyme [Muribaculaceae bacterium]|nr:SUMF1/EgtB/PvdO family nonheme iron enzyme [Muribaculaceae bacterium]
MLGKDETDAGDVTGDGSVDIADVNEVLNIMLGKTSFSSEPTTYTVGGVSFKMMPVLSGTFTMGDNNSTYSEKPAHQVTLGNYSIGQTEVTQALWVAVMGSNPSTFTDDPQCPVESVSWDDCQTFITKLNQMTGKRFRLPTEAEWEYAARGGRFSKGYTYAGGNNLSSVGFYWGNSGPYGNPFGTPKSTHPVAQKAPNELELYDMSGNVSEWCQDWFGYYTSDAQSNPTGPTTGQNRVYRGGSWNDEAGACTVTWRKNNTPSQSNMGLRLAL